MELRTLDLRSQKIGVKIYKGKTTLLQINKVQLFMQLLITRRFFKAWNNTLLTNYNQRRGSQLKQNCRCNQQRTKNKEMHTLLYVENNVNIVGQLLYIEIKIQTSNRSVDNTEHFTVNNIHLKR